MNTSYNTYTAHHRFSTQAARVAFQPARIEGREISQRPHNHQVDPGFSYGGRVQHNPAGVYSRQQLMRGMRGQHQPSSCNSTTRCSGNSPAAAREEATNSALTRTFQDLGKQFPQGANAVDRLAGDESRSTLVDLLGKNELVGAVQDLEKKGPVTVLAPSNEAFSNLAKNSPELFAKLTDPRNKQALQDILLYHVGQGATDFAQGSTFDSLLSNDGAKFSGNPFFGQFQNGDQTIRTGPASVSQNGSIVIPVDQVLIPPGFDPSKLL